MRRELRNLVTPVRPLSSPMSQTTMRSDRPARRLRHLPSGLLALLALFAFAAHASGQLAYLFPANVSVGTTSSVQSIPVTIQSAGSLGAIQVLTGGAPNLDYSLVTGGTCATGTTYSAGPASTCTVLVSLTARSPGIRSGAVVLLDSNGNLMGTQLIYGVGVGPLSVLTAGEIITVAGNGDYIPSPGSNNSLAVNAVVRLPVGVAVDGAGNIYYTDGDNIIGKVAPSGNLTIIAGTTGTSGSARMAPLLRTRYSIFRPQSWSTAQGMCTSQK